MSIYRMRTEFGKYLKPILYLIALVFIVGAVWQFGAAPTQGPETRERTQREIASVNSQPITQGEWDAQWEQTAEMARSQGVSSTLVLADMRAQTLSRLIQERMLMTAARQLGVEISADDVEARRDQMIVDHLKRNRHIVLGRKLSKEQEALDPREDSDYRSELANNKMSLDQQVQIAQSLIPVSQVQAQIAMEAVQKAIEKKAGRATDKDVINSYNVYKIRQIVLNTGSLPDDQLMSKAGKIAKEIKAGGDFAKLARENSEAPDKVQGGQAEYSFETSYFFPPEVGQTVTKLKPGQTSDVLKTDRGIYIVKLESVTPKLPAKLDKKTKDERRKQVVQMRQMTVGMALDKQIRAKADVRINDPEFRAYWQLSLAQQNAGDPKVYQKHQAVAIGAFRTAIKKDQGNLYATAKLGQLLAQQGQSKDALKLLYPLMTSPNSTAQGADLRMLLADLLVKDGKKNEAIEQYQKAGENAVNDMMVHQQLKAKFTELGRPDLAAKEDAWMAAYTKRMAELQAAQAKNVPKPPKPAPKAPREPRAGG